MRSEIDALRASLAGDPELEVLRGAEQEAVSEQLVADEAAAGTETRAAELRRRAKMLERQLFGGSIGNPQELLTLQRELDVAREKLETEEAQLLTDMERAEEAAGLVATAQAAVAERVGMRAAAAGPDARRLERLGTELAEAQSDREEIAAGTDAGALVLYNRLATRVRPVVAQLRGDSCGGCRHGLGIHQVREIRHGDTVVQCPDCDRILVP